MNTGPAFWLILSVGGAVLIGVLLAYGPDLKTAAA
jgi:hypothetical protein